MNINNIPNFFGDFYLMLNEFISMTNIFIKEGDTLNQQLEKEVQNGLMQLKFIIKFGIFIKNLVNLKSLKIDYIITK